jgi:HAD superfamily hydrolase (TIGR01509 family)
MSKSSPSIKAIIFDMDGTITEPVLDFDMIRQEVLEATGCSGDVETYPEKHKKTAWDIILRHEKHAEENQKIRPGLHDFLESCRHHRIPCGLLTLNCQRSVDALIRKYDLMFDIVITREHQNPKPHPAPVLEMTSAWNVAPSATLLIGDYIHDIECGKAAGTQTCFFQNPAAEDFTQHADYTVQSIQQLHKLVFSN